MFSGMRVVLVESYGLHRSQQLFLSGVRMVLCASTQCNHVWFLCGLMAIRQSIKDPGVRGTV